MSDLLTVDKVDPSIVFHAVDKNSKLAYDAEKYIWENPEPCWCEWNTANYMQKQMELLGYVVTLAGDIPGFYTEFDTGKQGPTIAVIAELDAIINPEHPCADVKTGAVHACGHHAQCAAMLAVAAAVKEPEVAKSLNGKIRFIAVPAEEGQNVALREELKKKEVLHYNSGKVEFLYRGYFEGVDMAFMVHLNDDEWAFKARRGSNGAIFKTATFEGKSSHAACTPHLGTDALYAANLAINAINSLRPSFEDGKNIRVHSIISDGGMAPNVVPSRVVVNTHVRAADVKTLDKVNNKVNKAMAAAAAAIGCKLNILDEVGAMPLQNDLTLLSYSKAAAELVSGDANVHYNMNERSAGYSDMGDITVVMPAIHPYCGGQEGVEHGADYYVKDVEQACVNNAKYQLLLLQMLLQNDAAGAKKVIANKELPFNSVQEYFEYLDSVRKQYDAVSYECNHEIILKY